MNGKLYKEYAQGRAKKSPIIKDTLFAFVSGGMICTAGQALANFYEYLGMSLENSGTLTSVTIVLVTAILTGFGVFDKIAKHCGGGTIVPISGFANAVTSAAIDNKTEGYILGVGAKIFSVAGPVILYGVSAGVVYGIIYYLLAL